MEHPIIGERQRMRKIASLETRLSASCYDSFELGQQSGLLALQVCPEQSD